MKVFRRRQERRAAEAEMRRRRGVAERLACEQFPDATAILTQPYGSEVVVEVWHGKKGARTLRLTGEELR